MGSGTERSASGPWREALGASHEANRASVPKTPARVNGFNGAASNNSAARHLDSSEGASEAVALSSRSSAADFRDDSRRSKTHLQPSPRQRSSPSEDSRTPALQSQQRSNLEMSAGRKERLNRASASNESQVEAHSPKFRAAQDAVAQSTNGTSPRHAGTLNPTLSLFQKASNFVKLLESSLRRNPSRIVA